MKRFFASILIALIVLIQCTEFLVYVSFKLNQNYIAQNLCVEKDLPESTCKGCCQLKKRVREQQNHKEEVPVTAEHKNELVYFLANSSFCIFNKIDKTPRRSISVFLYCFAYFSDCFHPPEFLEQC